MKIWAVTVLILTLALGLSIGGLVIGRRDGFWETIARYFLIGLIGLTIAAVTMVLIVIAIWPPYDVFSFILPFGFIILVVGVVYFVRSTNTLNLREGE